MRLFGKNNRVSPVQQKSENPKINNYTQAQPEERDTYYFCMPGNADFNMENGIIDFAAKINQERLDASKLFNDIEKAARMLRKMQLDLMAGYDSPMLQHKIQNDVVQYTEALIRMEKDLAYMEDKATFHLTLEQFYETPEKALKAAVARYPAHALSIVKISVNDDDMNLDHIGEREIARPNLFKVIESIQSVSQLETRGLLGIKDDLAKQKLSDKKLIQKVEEKTQEVLKELVANATVYEKSLIVAAKLSPDSQGRSIKRNSNSTSLPSIPEGNEKEYFKLVKVDNNISMAFQKKERPELTLEATSTRPRR
jgi:hypothetical protein